MSADDDRRRRFERLERPRGPGSGGEAGEQAGTLERFAGLGTEAPAPAVSPVPSAATDRFRPPPERAPEVAVAEEDAQPFRRCMRCEVDASRYARACPNCGADLDAPEQRDWNARLWARRKAERDELEAASRARQEAVAEAEAEATLARRQAAEAMARQVGDEVRERLEREQGGSRLWWRLRDLLRIVLGP